MGSGAGTDDGPESVCVLNPQTRAHSPHRSCARKAKVILGGAVSSEACLSEGHRKVSDGR